MLPLEQPMVKARNILLTLFLVFCALDIALVLIAQDAWAIGRILVIVAAMYFTMQGRKWAKWLLVGLCSLVAVGLVAMVLALGAQLSTPMVAGSLILVGLSTTIVVYMTINQEINRYFSYQRQARTQRPVS